MPIAVSQQLDVDGNQNLGIDVVVLEGQRRPPPNIPIRRIQPLQQRRDSARANSTQGLGRTMAVLVLQCIQQDGDGRLRLGTHFFQGEKDGIFHVWLAPKSFQEGPDRGGPNPSQRLSRTMSKSAFFLHQLFHKSRYCGSRRRTDLPYLYTSGLADFRVL